MGKPVSLDELVLVLVQRGLPVDYAERSVAELKDHHTDLAEQLRVDGMDEKQAAVEATGLLGEPRQLARQIVIGYRRHRRAGRWPMLTLTFAVAPPFVLIATWMLISALLVFSLCMFGIESGAQIRNPIAQWCVAYTFAITLMYCAPVLVALGFTCVARAIGCRKSWVVASGLGVGLLSSLLQWGATGEPLRFRFHAPAVHFSSLMQFFKWYALNPWQWLQLLLPLAVCLAACMFHDHRSHRTPCGS